MEELRWSYLGPVTGGIGRSGRASPSPPPSVRRWVSMVSGSRTNGDAFGIGPRTPSLQVLEHIVFVQVVVASQPGERQRNNV